MGSEIERIFTSSTSPGPAPSTYTGPGQNVGARAFALARDLFNHILSDCWIWSVRYTGLLPDPSGVLVSRVSTSMISPESDPQDRLGIRPIVTVCNGRGVTSRRVSSAPCGINATKNCFHPCSGALWARPALNMGHRDR